MRCFLLCLISVFFASDTVNFTIVHTNDIHGWVNGNKNSQGRDATFSDLENLMFHLKSEQTTDHYVYAFNSGDLIHGTGLSDLSTPPGSFVFQLVQNSSIDATTPGNHEMYNKDTIKYIATEAAPLLQDRYLSSNVQYVTQEGTSPLASPYKVITVPDFGDILVLGVLFSMTLADASVSVTPFLTLHDQLTWIPEQFSNPNLRLVVLISHCPPEYEWPNGEGSSIAEQLMKDIAEYHGYSLPFLFLGGHDHRLYFNNETAPQVRLESKSYMEMVTVFSFTLPRVKSADQVMESQVLKQVPGNRAEMMGVVGKDTTNWMTEKGQIMKDATEQMIKKLHLDEALGYSPHTFQNDPKDNTDNSLYHYFMNTVMDRMTPLKPTTPTLAIQFYTINNGSMRNPMYQGNVTYDDVIAVFPFLNTWCAIRGVSGTDLLSLIGGEVPMLLTATHSNTHSNMEDAMDTAMFMGHQHFTGRASPHTHPGIVNKEVPYDGRYVNISIDVQEDGVYDIITASYDAPLFLDILNGFHPDGVQYVIEESTIQLADTMVDYLKKYMHEDDDDTDSDDDSDSDSDSSDQPTHTSESHSVRTILLATLIPSAFIIAIIIAVVITYCICCNRHKKPEEGLNYERIDLHLTCSLPTLVSETVLADGPMCCLESTVCSASVMISSDGCKLLETHEPTLISTMSSPFD